MSELWSTTYEHAVRIFGQAPRAEDEQTIIDAFEKSPSLVTRQIDEVAAKLATGEVRWAWSFLAARLAKAQPLREATVNQELTRDKTIDKAKHWIINAGCYLPAEELERELWGEPELTAPLEILEQIDHDTIGNTGRPLYANLLRAAINRTRDEGQQEIPGTTGMLHAYRDDQRLHDDMNKLWDQHREAARATEREVGERANRYRDQRARQAELKQQLIEAADAIQNSAAESANLAPPATTNEPANGAVTPEAAAEHNPDQDIDFTKGTQ